MIGAVPDQILGRHNLRWGKSLRGVLSSCGVALAAAALFGSAIVADPARARAEPLDAQAESLQRAIDDFVAYLRSESYDAAAEAARLAREHRDEI